MLIEASPQSEGEAVPETLGFASSMLGKSYTNIIPNGVFMLICHGTK